MSDILNNTITTDTEKSFADAVQEWLGQHKDAVFGVAAAMAGGDNDFIEGGDGNNELYG